jgi:hypothetical protein
VSIFSAAFNAAINAVEELIEELEEQFLEMVAAGELDDPATAQNESVKNSKEMTETDPNRQGRAIKEQEKEEQEEAGEEVILKELDYVRGPGRAGKGLVMAVASPPPGQRVVVKLNAGHIRRTFPSEECYLLGHVYNNKHNLN